MEKKIAGIWFKVPCKNNIGSCSYGNICANLTNFHPKYFTKYDAPTKCPIPAGTFSIENVVVYEAKSIPSEANGEFHVTADISAATGHLACLHLDFSLKG
jgi:ganglioside GM2 activator